VVNGRDKARTESTAAEIAKATGAKVIAVVADVASRQVRTRSSPRCRSRTSCEQQRRATLPDFRELDGRNDRCVVGNMVVAIELIQKVIDRMSKKKFRPDRQYHVGLGEDADRRARSLVRRARRPHRVPRGRGAAGRRQRLTINFLLPGTSLTAADAQHGSHAKKQGITVDEASKARMGRAGNGSRSRRVRRGLRVLCSAACRYIPGSRKLIVTRWRRPAAPRPRGTR